MQSGWAYDAEAALPHSDPQLRTSETLLYSWVWLHATGGLVAAGGMRLYPLAAEIRP